MLPLIILSLVFVTLAVILLVGRGDKLIAGYNTMNAAQQKQVHIRRLRALVAGTLVITTGVLWIPFLSGHSESVAHHIATVIIIFIICIIVLLLANTWCIKK
ncbi:MAG: hypothetical protein AUK63_895 [bacterium P3]|nr:MAG: hypothetical protein AUK64_1052 [bacterium P201]KWW30449.1 MAG: hypothetical protein AUK63_895 [bacterium P3]KWW41336.1 MAG: hypothetical protein F083_1083 [bacterium F083]